MKAKILVVAIVGIALAAFGGSALAGWGWGPHMGPGYGPMGGYGAYQKGAGWQCPGWGQGGSGYAYRENLTDEQIQQLEQERNAFFQATEDARRNLYDARRALQEELSRENPDRARAAELQDQISGLRAELDQKRLEHRLAMQKIAPQAAGRHMGYGYGRGGRGGGYRW